MSYRKILSLFIIGFAFVISGCGDEEETTGGSVNVTLPSDAILISDANAITVAEAVVDSTSATGFASGIEVSNPQTAKAVKSIRSAVNTVKQSSNVVTGITESDPCIDGGSVSFSGSASATGSSGTLAFNNCVQYGVSIDGSMSVTFTWNDTTGAYSDKINGSFTISYFGETFTMVMNLSETGNYSSGDYTTDMTYSITGSPIGGFMVETTLPLIGNVNAGLTSGQLTVTGKNNTQLRITAISAYTASVEFNSGDGVWVDKGTVSIYY